ncbi:radical SAM protein, partial [Candidatus Parcubacteria bacterium]|nr:radical SAM protein [Patescibacteria group bacterium]MCG2686700.1 radical SAM protein [Candidatus Parcubacteria bacterium]
MKSILNNKDDLGIIKNSFDSGNGKILLVKDTLIIKDKKTFIIFSPFKRKITRINELSFKDQNTFQKLVDKGFFGALPKTTNPDVSWNGFNSLTLLLTRECNLDCIYCYASLEQRQKSEDSMTKDLALASVDWFVNQLKSNNIRVTFHGGGEPTLKKKLIKDVVQYTESIKGNKKTRYLITTNGTTTRDFWDWMIENRVNISVSMDGPPDIQDRNRPFAITGFGSSKIVERNIKYLIAKNYPFSIRLTYSPVDDIVKVMKYFGDLGVKKIHLEPLFPHGRDYKKVKFGKSSGYKIYSPQGKELLKDFFVAMDLARKYRIKIYNGHLINFTRGVGYFCGSASSRSMTVTHDGFLTACLEVVDKNDLDKENFFIGRFDQKTKNFQVDFGKIKFLQKRHADLLSKCKECYARYHCAGGCAIKAVRFLFLMYI